MTTITTDVPFSPYAKKICSKCGEAKEVTNFSLLRGTHSEQRKNFCVTCEGLIRKARKLYDLDLEVFNELMRRPCSICGDNASHIDKSKRINGVLCKRCWSFLKSVMPTDEDDVIQRCYNYIVFREKFPFFLKWELLRTIPPPETPLLDLINDE